MSLKLYYSPGACSFVPHALLEASGAAYEPMLVKLHKGEQKSPEYTAINPRGQVPVLVDGDEVITQILAICLYLDEKFPQSGFLPAKGAARAHALEALAWMNNTAHPTFTHVFMPGKFIGDEDGQAKVKARAIETFQGVLAELEALVAKKPGEWLSGAHFGPLDAYALTLARWGTFAAIKPAAHPTLWAHVHHVAAHPAVARVMERERLQLDVSPA